MGMACRAGARSVSVTETMQPESAIAPAAAIRMFVSRMFWSSRKSLIYDGRLAPTVKRAARSTDSPNNGGAKGVDRLPSPGKVRARETRV